MTRFSLGSAMLLGLAMASATTAADQALLVGLDRYGDSRVPETPGGRLDAESMVETLEKVFGFPAANIEVLLDEAATSEAIVERFERRLIDGTNPGDRVFFLYAGHGSQLADQENGDEDDGFDETLAPFDVDPTTGAGQIRDDVIDGLIAQLAGRRAVLLFDSCHSGTLTRSAGGATDRGDGVRYLPRPDQYPATATTRGKGGGQGGYSVVADPRGEQSPFDRPGAAAKAHGIVAIAAAGPGQLAFPVNVNGRPRGALTYLFQQAVSVADEAVADPELASRNLWKTLGENVLGAATGTAEDAVNAAIREQLGGNSGLGGLGDYGGTRPGKGNLGDAVVGDLKAGVTVGVLETLIDEGMERLQESGRLEGNQEPFFEVLSERPLEEEPLFGDWQAASAAAMTNPLDDRRVALYTEGDRRLFMDGESMVLHVETNRPGYLYLLVFSEEQRTTCLFPNSLDAEMRITAGRTTVPTHDGYHLPVQEPFGRDMIVALVSDAPMPLCERAEYHWDEIFARVYLDEIHAQLRREIRRGVGVQSTRDTGKPTLTGWQTATLEVHTRRGPRP